MMKWILLSAAAMIGTAGCASPLVFDERSNGQTVEVEQGRAFSISLRGSSWKLGPFGGVVAPTGRAREDSADRDVFQFKAEATGEVELRFSGGDPKRPSECVIRVKVRPPSEYYMKPHTG